MYVTNTKRLTHEGAKRITATAIDKAHAITLRLVSQCACGGVNASCPPRYPQTLWFAIKDVATQQLKGELTAIYNACEYPCYLPVLTSSSQIEGDEPAN